MTGEQDYRMIHVEIMKQAIIDLLGPEKALEEVCKALPTDTLEETFAYILKCYDAEEVTS